MNSVEPPRAGSLPGSRRRHRNRPPATTLLRMPGATVRLAPWPADPRTAQLTVLPGEALPTASVISDALDEVRAAGFRAVVTGALGEIERAPFTATGFAPRAWLHLLERSLYHVPSARPSGAVLRRIRRSEWPAVAGVDAGAFAPFWRLGVDGIVDARRATPSNRLRVAVTADDAIVGYAVFGRSGARGFVQRIAVHPAAHGRGIGTTLLVDGLRWLSDRGALTALVNTQLDNERALQLYRHLGFRLLHERLAVLGRTLDDCP